MDVDMMKQRPPSPVSEDQMDMLSIMMQMEKLPDFNDPFEHSNVSTIPFPEIQFTSIAASSNLARPPTIHQNADEASLGSLIPVTSPIQLLANNPGHEQEKYSQISPFPNMGPYPDKKNNNSMAAMREMIFRIAVMQPIHIDPESIKPPKRRNVKISKDPQSVAARHRRERISERIRILQRLVPGGTKMDTASMLDEAIHYLKFLKKQVQSLEQAAVNRPVSAPVGFPGPVIGNMGAHSGSMRGCQLPMSSHYHHQAVGNLQMLR